MYVNVLCGPGPQRPELSALVPTHPNTLGSVQSHGQNLGYKTRGPVIPIMGQLKKPNTPVKVNNKISIQGDAHPQTVPAEGTTARLTVGGYCCR